MIKTGEGSYSRRKTWGEKMETAFWEPNETKPQAPQETLLTIRLHPPPMNTLSTPTAAFWTMAEEDISVLECVCFCVCDSARDGVAKSTAEVNFVQATAEGIV